MWRRQAAARRTLVVDTTTTTTQLLLLVVDTTTTQQHPTRYACRNRFKGAIKMATGRPMRHDANPHVREERGRATAEDQLLEPVESRMRSFSLSEGVAENAEEVE